MKLADLTTTSTMSFSASLPKAALDQLKGFITLCKAKPEVKCCICTYHLHLHRHLHRHLHTWNLAAMVQVQLNCT